MLRSRQFGSLERRSNSRVEQYSAADGLWRMTGTCPFDLRLQPSEALHE